MANLNTALSPSPVVTVVNKDGTTATGYTGNVTMALGTNPTNATLGGTTVVAASSGVATFSNLTLNRSGKNFTLQATAAAQGGYTPKARVSRPFTIATRCVFTTQPVGTAAAGDIMPTFTVTVQDSAGNTDTAYNGEITVALYTGAGSGILGGFTTRLATAGVADFSGLSIDDNGTYSLRATAESVSTAYDPAPAVSNTFVIPSIGFTLVAGSSGLQSGYVESGFGTLTPTTINGNTLASIINDTFGGDTVSISIVATLSQNFFTSMTIGGTTFTSASATFEGLPGQSTWIWEDEQYAFVDATPYAVVFAMP